MCVWVWARIRCCEMLTRARIIYFYLFGCLVFGFRLNKGTGVFRADVAEHDTQIPNTHKMWRNILVSSVVIFRRFCSVFTKWFNGRWGTILPFSVEIFTRVRAWELVHNFQQIGLGPTQQTALFTFSPQIRFKRNFKMDEEQTWIRARPISRWNDSTECDFIVFGLLKSHSVTFSHINCVDSIELLSINEINNNSEVELICKLIADSSANNPCHNWTQWMSTIAKASRVFQLTHTL